MKVLFIQPPTNPHVWGGDAIFIIEPLWAEYLGAGLKSGHDVLLLDMRLQKSPLKDTLRDFQPGVVGITAYTVDVNTVKQLAKEIKAFNKEIRVVVGGFHANKNYAELLDSDIDIVVPGEGVNTMRELVDALEKKGRSTDLRGIKGLAIKTDGRVEKTQTRPWPSLDSYPVPDRSMSADIRENYFYKNSMKPVTSITSSYSCKFRCEFCCLWPMTDGKYLVRSPESLVDEIASIKDENIWFTDDEAFLDGDRMEKIARLIEERGIKKRYFFMARSDSIRRNPEKFELWAKIGLDEVMVGFESIRTKDLIDFNKSATVRDNDTAIDILQKNNIDIRANFVLTQDYEPHDFDNIQRYVDDKKLTLPLYFILTPFPGTATYQKMKDSIFLNDYDYYDLLHTVLPTKMPLRDFYFRYSKLYEALEPLHRGISDYGENLDEIVVSNVRKMMESMRSGKGGNKQL